MSVNWSNCLLFVCLCHVMLFWCWWMKLILTYFHNQTVNLYYNYLQFFSGCVFPKLPWKRCSATPCHCKRGRATPWTYKKGVATPWTCNQSLIKPSGFYSMRCSTFTRTPKRSKEIDPPLSVKCLLKRKQTNKPVCITNANASNQQWWLVNLAWHNASIVSHFSRKETNIHPKLIYYAYVVM